MITGSITILQVKHSSPVEYILSLGNQKLKLNDLLGKNISLKWLQKINCIHCNTSIKKSYHQGSCYPCFIKLPQCDLCILKPEQCHFHKGTCRDPSWGEKHCMISHTIYLSYSSNVKVGITRTYQQTTRWIHQGAVQALAIGQVENRYQSGLVEVSFKKFVQDKTNWRKMLTHQDNNSIHLPSSWEKLKQYWPTNITNHLITPKGIKINYPVLSYPDKIISHNLEKEHTITGELKGIKGSYLIFPHKVINLRKYIGYAVSLTF